MGKRQVACADPDCQKERHRRACARWRAAEQVTVRRDSLSAAVSSVVDSEVKSSSREVPVVEPTSVKRVRDGVPDEVAVLIGVFAKHLLTAAKDALGAEVSKVRAEFGSHARHRPKTPSAPGPPTS